MKISIFNLLPKIILLLIVSALSLSAIADKVSLSPKEKAVLDFIVPYSFSMKTIGQPSLFESSLPGKSATIKELQDKFRENEVLWDDTYLEQPVFINGVVGAIRSGNGNPYVELLQKMLINGQPIKAAFHSSVGREYIANLRQGNELDLACLVDKSGNIPVLKECVPEEVIIMPLMKIIYEDIKKMTLQENGDIYDISLLAIAASKSLASFLPNNSKCGIDEEKCFEELISLGDVLNGKSVEKTMEICNQITNSGWAVKSF